MPKNMNVWVRRRPQPCSVGPIAVHGFIRHKPAEIAPSYWKSAMCSDTNIFGSYPTSRVMVDQRGVRSGKAGSYLEPRMAAHAKLLAASLTLLLFFVAGGCQQAEPQPIVNNLPGPNFVGPV